MHLHGFNMYILHEGDGPDWDGTIIHPENPQRRDVVQLRPNGHLVIQFDAGQNPGMQSSLPISYLPKASAYADNVMIFRCLALSLPHCVARLGRLLHAVCDGRG